MKELIEANYKSIVDRGFITPTTTLFEFLDKIDEEVKKELELILEKLREAHKNEDVDLVNKHTEELNTLWTKASQQMYENMKKDDVDMPEGAEEQHTQDADFEEVK